METKANIIKEIKKQIRIAFREHKKLEGYVDKVYGDSKPANPKLILQELEILYALMHLEVLVDDLCEAS